MLPTRTPFVAGVLFLLLPAALLLAGCQEEAQIEHYTVPKADSIRPSDSSVPLAEESAGEERTYAARMLAAVLTQGETTWFFKLTGPDKRVADLKETFLTFVESVHFGEEGPEWSLPEGWSRRPGSGMRYATIEIGTPRDRVELAVTPLPSGEDWDAYLLANVNRWRRQLQLSPIGPEQLDEAVEELSLNGRSVTLVELAGRASASDSGSRAPLLSGSGPGPLKPQGARGAPDELTYEKPENWEPGRLNRMRKAAFEVRDGGAEVEITITALPPSGLLPNVNRWRKQVGLPPITKEELQKERRELSVGERKADYVEIVGENETILAAMLERGRRTWFFKLRGDSRLAERERPNFEAFVQSVGFE